MRTILGKNIKELRVKESLTQKDLADEFSVSQNTIHMWEAGKTEPNAETIQKIADYFSVDVNFLLGYGNPSSKKKPTGEPMSFERFVETLNDKGLTEKDIENLSKEQLATIVDIVKNFKP